MTWGVYSHQKKLILRNRCPWVWCTVWSRRFFWDIVNDEKLWSTEKSVISVSFYGKVLTRVRTARLKRGRVDFLNSLCIRAYKDFNFCKRWTGLCLECSVKSFVNKIEIVGLIFFEIGAIWTSTFWKSQRNLALYTSCHFWRLDWRLLRYISARLLNSTKLCER